ncbi:hypothetical protein ACF07Y_36925 [Streptomyces sp. NPDC016566]
MADQPGQTDQPEQFDQPSEDEMDAIVDGGSRAADADAQATYPSVLLLRK